MSKNGCPVNTKVLDTELHGKTSGDQLPISSNVYPVAKKVKNLCHLIRFDHKEKAYTYAHHYL